VGISIANRTHHHCNLCRKIGRHGPKWFHEGH
jgi:hypothetical protein